MNKLHRVKDLATELKLHLKVVVSTKNFGNYNSFFNIYDEWEEPCRRIVILTPYEGIEEVSDECPSIDIIENSIIDGNVWLKEFPLTTNASNIDLNELYISSDEADKIKEFYLRDSGYNTPTSF